MSAGPVAAEPTPAESEPDTGRLDGASPFRIWMVMIAVILFSEVSALQYTMVSAAIPKMAESFPSVGANIGWVLTIFGLVSAAVTPILGKFSDMFGKKRMIGVTGILFFIGSILCATVSSWGLFLFGRALEACAVVIATLAYGLFRDILPRKYVPMSVGFIATGLGVSALAAPFIAGWMTDTFSWRAIFWFLVIFTVITFPLFWFVVPESKLRTGTKIDYLGGVLIFAGIGSLLLYISEGNTWGWSRPSSFGYGIAGVVLLVIFVFVERAVESPIMDMRLLVSPKVSMTLLVTFCGSLVTAGVGYVIPYMLETPKESTFVDGAKHAAAAKGADLASMHFSIPGGLAFAAGLGLVGFAVHSALFQGLTSGPFGPISGAWARRAGARKPMILAMVVFIISGVLLWTLAPHGVWMFAIIGLFYGFGFAAYFAATPNLIIEAVPARQQGVSAGMMGVVQFGASAVGGAVLTSFFMANPLKMQTIVNGHVVNESVITTQLYSWHGYELAFLFIIIVSAVGLVATLLMRHGRTPSTGGIAPDRQGEAAGEAVPA